MRLLQRALVLVFLTYWVAAAQQPKASLPGQSQKTKPGTQSTARSKAQSNNVILITLDTVRADRMDFLGSKRGLTPNLDLLAKDGVVFTRAYSHVPLTPPSHATILTGTYPQFNHVDDFGSRLGKDIPYLPDILHARGYRTAAFVSSVILDPIQGSAPGFDRGFDVYDAGFHRRRPREDRYQSIERRAEEVVARAQSWLAKQRPGSFFLWLHFYDAHDPYDPPEPFKTKYADAAYDGEIAYVDSVVGKFLESLRSKGLYKDTLISVMADHGESLGDHGETAHGVFLYDETIHVPLVMKLPGNASAGKQLENRASLVDVTPTILQALAIPVPGSIQGTSLLAAMKAHPGDPGLSEADRPAFAETLYPRKAFGFSSVHALRTGKYLFVDAPRKELYDQSTDPQAERNLSDTAKAITDTLTQKTIEFRKKTASTTNAPKVAPDPEAQEKLNALGYVASQVDDDVKVGAGIQDTGADPKDKIGTVNLLHDAILNIENNQYEEAITRLQKVLTTDPGIPMAYMQLGTAYSWLKDYDQAVPVLRKAVEMRPDVLMPQYELGLALSATGDWVGSIPHFEAAVQKSPKWGALHFSLAAAYGQVGRMDDSRRELEAVLKITPDDFRANLVFGRMLVLQDKPSQGLVPLKKAARLQPNDPNPHMFLSDAYARLGQRANAEREHQEAERLKSAAKPSSK
ncbi:MAG: sulfatase-like hydrolase/transferase [Acidobacteria bacterium]|nr:sulfatase-like hydrolase/transferase [Acidobacteriota bacterium]